MLPSEGENTPPSLISVGFREGRLLTEGDSAHLEALVYDFDYCCAKSDYTAGTTGGFVVTEGGAGLVADGGCFDDTNTFDTCLCGKPLDCVARGGERQVETLIAWRLIQRSTTCKR